MAFALSFLNQFFGIGRHQITSRARDRIAQLVTEPARRVAGLKTADFFAARAAEVDIKAARRILRRAGGQSPEPDDRLAADR